jgi:hypothetical protein
MVMLSLSRSPIMVAADQAAAEQQAVPEVRESFK